MQPDIPPPDANERAIMARLLDPESARFGGQLCVPQFGILHILILTAVTAVLLKLQLVLMDEQTKARPWLQGIQIAYMMLVACGLVGSGVLIRLKCYTMFRRLQPGHWIVLISAFASILGLANWAFVRYFIDSGSTTHSGNGLWWIYRIFSVLIYLMEAAAYAYATLKLRDARRWKMLLGAMAASTGLSAIFIEFWLLSSVAILLILLIAVFLDIPRWASRDWIHGLGVGIVGMSCCLNIGWRILSWFLMKP